MIVGYEFGHRFPEDARIEQLGGVQVVQTNYKAVRSLRYPKMGKWVSKSRSPLITP